MSVTSGIDTSQPIYEALANRLRQSIRSGKYQPGQLIDSEHQLARRESISRMTVRRASELLVQEGLVERRPGKGLFVREAHVATRIIRVIAGNLRWEPSLQVSRGIQDLARTRGIQTQLYDAHGDMELDLETLRRLPETDADGAVIVSLHSRAFNEAIFELKRRNYPFVLVDQTLHDIQVPSVTADNHQGGRQVAEHLIGYGHRRIGFLGDLVAGTVCDRLAGFRDAIADAGLPFDRSLVIDIDEDKNRLGDWSAKVEERTRQLMQRDDPPTAIFCSCDAVARSSVRALTQIGLGVPGDVSVVGFDNDPLAEWVTPMLTTIQQPFVEMGRAALEMLCARMAQPTADVPSRVLPTALVVRDSVSSPASHGDSPPAAR